MIIEGNNAIQHQVCEGCLTGQALITATEEGNEAFLNAQQEALERVQRNLELAIDRRPKKRDELEALSVEATQRIISVDGLQKVICGRDGPGRNGKCGAKMVRASKRA